MRVEIYYDNYPLNKTGDCLRITVESDVAEIALNELYDKDKKFIRCADDKCANKEFYLNKDRIIVFYVFY